VLGSEGTWTLKRPGEEKRVSSQAGAEVGEGAGREQLVVAASDGDHQVWAAKGGLCSLVFGWLEPVEWHGGCIRIRAGAGAGAGSGDGRDGGNRKVGEKRGADERGCTLVGQRRRHQRYFYRTGSQGASQCSSRSSPSQKQWG